MTSKIEIVLDGHNVRYLNGPYIKSDLPTEAGKEFAELLISQLSQMKKYAAENLMDAYDSLWPEDQHEKLTMSEFEANLTSPQIIIRDKIGAASVYFDDSGMFRDDFYLKVSITDGNIVDVSLE